MDFTGDDGTNIDGTIGFLSSPVSFPGLLRWYKADSFLGIASDGDTIGGMANTRQPWRDISGNFTDSGVTTASQAGPSTTVDISGGTFTFAVGDVGKTIQYDGGTGRDALIVTYVNPTQVVVDVSQTVPATQFGLYDNAQITSTGPAFKTGIVGAMPIIRFDTIFGGIYIKPGALTGDFTIIAASAVTDVTAGTSSEVVSDPFGTGHQFRRHYGPGGETNVMLFFGGAGLSISTDPLEMSTPPLATDFMLTVLRRSGNIISFRQNKTNKASMGGVDGTPFVITQIGSTNAGSTYMDLGELTIHTSYIADADLDKLYDQYYKPRWVTLP